MIEIKEQNGGLNISRKKEVKMIERDRRIKQMITQRDKALKEKDQLYQNALKEIQVFLIQNLNFNPKFKIK